jgi:MFS transporter, DHA2 family, multidrug resistance protein
MDNRATKWIIALSVVLPTLLEVIDTSVVNVSLNHIRGSLSAGLDESTWTITAYLVSNAIIIPLSGWLSRVFGRKRYLTFSVILFTVSSFMCGSAKTLSMLVFFRVIQGLGGGALQPLSQSILLESFPPIQHGMAMAMFGIGVMVGPIVGPVLGGWITDNWSWPWIFYINIPIGILSVIMIMLFIHDPDYLKREKETIDYWGIGLIAVGLGALQVVLDKGQQDDWFQSAFIVRLAIIAVVCLVAFVFVERKAKHPVVNLRVFKDISFTSANCIQSIAFFVLYGSITLLPLFLQNLMGYNAYLAGLALAPGGIVTLLMMPITAQLMKRVNHKILLACGLLIVAYSTYVASHFNLAVDFWMVIIPRVYLGLGMALVFVPLTSMAFSTIRKEEMSNATSIFSLNRNISGSFGIAFITTMLARRAQFHQARFTEQLSSFDMRYQMAMHKAEAVMGAHNVAGAKAVVYTQLMQQSNLNAFVDTFYLTAIIMCCVVPLVIFLKQPVHNSAGMVH